MMDFAVPLATSPNTEVRNPVVCWVDLLKGTNEVQKPTIYLKNNIYQSDNSNKKPKHNPV